MAGEIGRRGGLQLPLAFERVVGGDEVETVGPVGRVEYLGFVPVPVRPKAQRAPPFGHLWAGLWAEGVADGGALGRGKRPGGSGSAASAECQEQPSA